MSIEKNINSRIVHKHDVEANWIKATNFIPKQGEIIIYDVDDNHSYPRFKIGDGLTLVNNLPFVIVQSDQNQNDETAIDFIKNRLAYTIPGEYEIISDADVPFIQGEVNGHSLYFTELTPLVGNWIDYNILAGVSMQLIINDKVFNFTTKANSEIPNCIYGGNLGLSWVNQLDTGEDFFIQAGLDTPEDTTGFCILVLTDLKPAESYRVSLKVIVEPDAYKKLDTNYYDRLAWVDNKTTTISFNGNISEDKIHNWNSEVFYYHIYVSPRKIIPKDIIEIERTDISTGKVTKKQIVLQKTYEGSNIIYGVQDLEFVPYVKIAPEPFEFLGTTYPAGTYFTLFADGLENIHSYVSKATLLLESNVHQIDPIYYERLGWAEDEEILFENITFIHASEESLGFIGALPAPLNLQANYSYLFTIDDEEYELIPSLLQVENESLLALGNLNILTSPQLNDKGCPFVFVPVGSMGLLIYSNTAIDQNAVNVSLKKNKYIHKIHEQYYDRIAGINKPEEIILQDVILKADEEVQNLFIADGFIPLNENAKYLLEINNKQYNVICKKLVEDEFEAYFLGNSNYIGIQSDDTEPFVFASVPNEQLIQLYIDDSNASECTISLKASEDITVIDSKFLPLATFNQLGVVAPETKTKVDVQPVTVDEEGRLWTEPTSNTIATDDGDGNVVLITMATQEPENIVTDDGDGNVEVHSTSVYNPFPGIESAAVGQMVRVAEIDEDGTPIKWEMINVEDLKNDDIFVVDVNMSELTTSATSEEISAQYNLGKTIIGSFSGLLGMIIPEVPNYAYGYISIVERNSIIYYKIQINSSTVTLFGSGVIDFSTFITTDTYSDDKTALVNILNDKITTPTSAEVGQVLSVKTIDNNGIPTEWEATTITQPKALVNSVNSKTGDVVLTATDVGALSDTTTIPTSLADLTSDYTHRVVTDSEKSTWNNKANAIHSHDPNAFAFTGYKSGSLDPISMGWIGSASSNKSFGLPQDAIQIEYSVDGGLTWTISEEDGRPLFNESRSHPFYLGNATTAELNSLDCMMRVTITPTDRYTYFRGVYHWMSTQGNTVTFDLERSTIGNPDTFVTILTDQPISGWSGNNIHYFAPATFGGGDTQLANSYKYRLTYKMTALDATRSAAIIMDIRFFGENVWDARSTSRMIRNMVQYNTPYSLDTINDRTIFPNAIQATSIIMPDTVTGTLYELSIANGQLQIGAI